MADLEEQGSSLTNSRPISPSRFPWSNSMSHLSTCLFILLRLSLKKDMKFPWIQQAALLLLFFFCAGNCLALAQDGNDGAQPDLPPKAADCTGIFLSYAFVSRTKEFPHLKNATAQSWAFKATASILNAGTVQLDAWQMFIGFQHREILVSATGAVLLDSGDFPADASNGTYLSGYPLANLKTSIDTAGDLNQIMAQIQLTGTQFGVKPPGVPLPKTIKLMNDGYKCPAPKTQKNSMYVCCVKDKKYRPETVKTKFLPRQKGDLSMFYDIMQAYGNNYLAQVTIQNKSPLGRLDHWNLTWEWMRGEFINTMRGAYTRLRDPSECIYGPAGVYYKDMDFSKVMNCQKRPIISDLPRDRANDTQIGKIPFCCRNGSILPNHMDPSESKTVFQVAVYKLPPDLSRTALYPPQKWKIVGFLNPDYKCGAPIRVSPTEYPDPSGLTAISLAIATWQVVCNISRPAARKSRCCVSFSAYYNDSAMPCDTCACGCPSAKKCSTKAPAMLLPAESLLVPNENRTEKAVAWARLKHFKVPRPLPCPDNCGVSINWHITTDYGNGWAARITLFNWEEINFENWFTAIQLKKAGRGYEKAYSFNGTFLQHLNNTIFLQGLKGLNYLVAETNGPNPDSDPRVPGKQQSVISFSKKTTPGVEIAKGDGFPSRVYFNGEECAIPTRFPTAEGSQCRVNFVQVVLLGIIAFVMLENHH